MLDLFAVITTGGIILFVHSPGKLDYVTLMNKVMQEAIIDSTLVGTTFLYGALELHWTICHELGLVFIAAFQKILPLTYVPRLLEQAKTYFIKNYKDRLQEDPFTPINDFDKILPTLCTLAEEKENIERKMSKSPVNGNKPERVASTKSGKQMRDWGDKVRKDTIASLDMSSDKPSEDEMTPVTSSSLPSSRSALLEELEFEVEKEEPSSSTGIWKYFDNLTGQKEITRADLETAEVKMKSHLMAKNVAADVAQVICKSVSDSLVGKKTGTFKTISQLVKEATEVAVSRILIPKSSVDLLDEIRRTAQGPERRPYVMAFVGVNGVGKSTNLSKVCFWLLQSNLKILIVAGDTFRSGAVEQLRTHVRNLSVGRDPAQLTLFERGYGKDAAGVARDAIEHAKQTSVDVVMIDTAGRMQDNAPLMAALAKLVYTNKPDKLIFVGEALVGNEAVDQLSKFNAALRDNATGEVRRIDGILLTKFDTIDDKVGAALTMTFVAAAPILFVGIGQTYTDLRKLNVKSIVATLLK